MACAVSKAVDLCTSGPASSMVVICPRTSASVMRDLASSLLLRMSRLSKSFPPASSPAAIRSRAAAVSLSASLSMTANDALTALSRLVGSWASHGR